MSQPIAHDDGDETPTLRPPPKRRPFDLSGFSTPSSAPSTPVSDTHPSASQLKSSLHAAAAIDGTSTPSRTRSILNLTSSTLFGIYSPTGYATDREEVSTPWGTGAETPVDSRNGSMDALRSSIPENLRININNNNNNNNNAKASKPRRRRSTLPHHTPKPRGFKRHYLPLLSRNLALFAAGLLYGLLVSHLRDTPELRPVRFQGLDNASSRYYLTFWGLAGIALGQALPYFDTLWAASDSDEEDDGAITDEDADRSRNTPGSGDRATPAWTDVLRSTGAFVGIAFAIRKLPWQSTLQLSLTLALANPAIWWLIDRSPPGFILSSLVALMGTVVLLGVGPGSGNEPAQERGLGNVVGDKGVGNANGTQALGNGSSGEGVLVLGLWSQEAVGVTTWIASVLFVSSVCFGNIGRRLAPRTAS